MEEHSHSNCSGHSHSDNEQITPKKNPKNDKKIFRYLYVVGFILLVIGATFLNTCVNKYLIL